MVAWRITQFENACFLRQSPDSLLFKYTPVHFGYNSQCLSIYACMFLE